MEEQTMFATFFLTPNQTLKSDEVLRLPWTFGKKRLPQGIHAK